MLRLKKEVTVWFQAGQQEPRCHIISYQSCYQAVLQELITTHIAYLIKVVYFLRHMPLRSME